MTYLEQIEQYVAYYLPASCGVTQLPAYPHVQVHVWAEDYCELADGTGAEIARFRLVG